MRDIITEWRSLLGNEQAIERNIENAQKTITRFENNIKDLKKNIKEGEKSLKEIKKRQAENEKSLNVFFEKKLKRIAELESLCNSAEQEGWVTLEEKEKISHLFAEEESLIAELIEVKNYIKIDF